MSSMDLPRHLARLDNVIDLPSIHTIPSASASTFAFIHSTTTLLPPPIFKEREGGREVGEMMFTMSVPVLSPFLKIRRNWVCKPKRGGVGRETRLGDQQNKSTRGYPLVVLG